jgi:hypothetical protein
VAEASRVDFAQSFPFGGKQPGLATFSALTSPFAGTRLDRTSVLTTNYPILPIYPEWAALMIVDDVWESTQLKIALPSWWNVIWASSSVLLGARSVYYYTKVWGGMQPHYLGYIGWLTYYPMYACMVSCIMKRTGLYLKTQQLLKLQKLSNQTGAPVAELVRRAIDAYLKQEQGTTRWGRSR